MYVYRNYNISIQLTVYYIILNKYFIQCNNNNNNDVDEKAISYYINSIYHLKIMNYIIIIK